MILCGIVSLREENLIQIVERLSKDEKVTSIIIVEGDAQHVEFLRSTFKANDKISLHFLAPSGGSRVENIALARKRLLDLAQTDRTQFEGFLMLDVGRENSSFSPDFAKLLERTQDDEILTAMQADGYYDIFALRTMNEHLGTRRLAFSLRSKLASLLFYLWMVYPLQQKVLHVETRVRSAFGGAFFTSKSTLQKLDYSFSGDGFTCEHTSMMFKAADSGVKVYISPLLQNGPIKWRISLKEKLFRKLGVSK